MVDLEDVVRAQLARAAAVEAVPVGLIVDAYARAWQHIRAWLDALTARVAEAGPAASPAWLRRQDALRDLEQGVAREVGAAAQRAAGAVSAAQSTAVQLAGAHAAEVATGQPWWRGRPFRPPPPETVRALAGALADGRPLAAHLAGYGAAAAAAVRSTLLDGVAAGDKPSAIARRVRTALGGSMADAVTLARSEVMRAYREATRAAYRANADAVAGWRWRATRSARTCAFCWAMHGSEHDLGEPMATHPRCRCSLTPMLRGAPTTRAARGPELFARLPAETQRRVLGPAKAAAFEAGAMRLEDLVATGRSARWGPVGWERSLTDVLGADRARSFVAVTKTV